MLAREGYTVLELGYNLPQYGQKDYLSRREPYDLNYIEMAIKKLLNHHSVYGDKVAIIGQSKGAELANAAACLMPNLIELSVTNSKHVANPLLIPVNFQSTVYPAMTVDFSIFSQTNNVSHITGIAELLKWRNKPILGGDQEDGWWLDKDVFREALSSGFPMSNANKIVHCQTLADPSHRKSENIEHMFHHHKKLIKKCQSLWAIYLWK